MVTGTLVQKKEFTTAQFIYNPDETAPSAENIPEEQITQQMLTDISDFKLNLVREDDDYRAYCGFSNMTCTNIFKTNTIYLDNTQEKNKRQILSIWDSAKLTDLLSKPVGSPIDLTFEEAREIVRLAAGRRPDLPKGKEFVREVRELIGHSMIDKLDKSERS